jgi:leader peptidase (prepilin peptidase)/N-methyltransferase
MTPADFFWICMGFAFVFGTLIGSFLNVVIYRVPEGLSVVAPPSHCPKCGENVRWYDNIPIVSWFVLRGKCRSCKAPISPRYAIVEALTGVMAVGAWHSAARWMLDSPTLPNGGGWVTLIVVFALYFTFLALLIVISFVDLDHLVIPHRFSLPGIGLGLLSPWIMRFLMGPHGPTVFWPPVTPLMSLIGALVGFGAVVAIFYMYLAVRGVEGIGGGDATLMAMVGAWLGWPALLFVLFAASLQGIVVAGIAMLFGSGFIRDSRDIFVDEDDAEAQPARAAADEEAAVAGQEPVEAVSDEATGRAAVPFGPFIALAAAEHLLLGPHLPAELSLVYLYM